MSARACGRGRSRSSRASRGGGARHHHAWFVYERFRTAGDPAWAAFFDAMAAARDERLRALGLPLDELLAD